VGYRLDLYRGREHLGFHDGVAAFEAGAAYTKKITIVEGPFVCRNTSDEPGSVVIAFETDEICAAEVHVFDWPLVFRSSTAGTRHEIPVTGLQPGQAFPYRVICGTTATPQYTFETAPAKGEGRVVFAFGCDSREGVGGGEKNYMGHNLQAMRWISHDAIRRGAQFMIFAGDLVNGYTSDTEDMRLQLKGWKQGVAAFWRTRPVFTTIGNPDSLIRVFDDGSIYGVCMDKWPYVTDSTEAVFAQEFVNPVNGPVPSDPRRPSYKESVYKFQYGPVLCVAFNNNYWWTTNTACATYGGSPEGYILPDQLEWIEKTLAEAEQDPTVRFIVLYAQEPVFPCGGHVADAMWYGGSIGVCAYVKVAAGAVEACGPGIIDVRNRLWEAVAASKKVAAVVVGDEHAYHRLLVTGDTPVGIAPQDDTDGDGILDRFSRNPKFANPTWQLTAGTAGGPWHSQEQTPWKPEKFSSQEGYLLFETHGERMSVKFITTTGQIVDHVEDLMHAKRP
jgi:hypothetical protein